MKALDEGGGRGGGWMMRRGRRIALEDGGGGCRFEDGCWRDKMEVMGRGRRAESAGWIMQGAVCVYVCLTCVP